VRRLLVVAGICVLALVTASVSQAQSKDPFNGFYVGGNIGGSFSRVSARTTTVFSPTGYFAASSVPAIAAAGAQSLSLNGFTGGGQVGYNYSADHFMMGIEVDFSSLSATGSKSVTAIYPCCVTTGFTVTQTATTKWMGTVRPRIGYVRGRFLFYGTVGGALGDINYRATFVDTFATPIPATEHGGTTQNRLGWVAGGGAEYSLRHHWSVKGEYLYATFSRATALSTNLTAFSGPIPFPSNFFVHSAFVHAHVVRGGVNYTF
jgi:outer membrane immunogenic protein